MNNSRPIVVFAFYLAGLGLAAVSLALLVLDFQSTAIATVAAGVFCVAVAGLLQNPLR